ncbi:M24 family metallopeptidase [Halobellus rufus]|uniref:M24 family metallopeptidase n=1 Tax=Halobellus rufus TaxID=1448860 RepID=UPI0009DE252C|nr:M24 family metallopeptidase [Halobellus rufus]
MSDDSDAGEHEAAADPSATHSPSTPPAVDRSFLDDVIDDRDAAGFVAVGGRDDADLRYLTGFDGPSDHYAYVRAAGASVLCPPAGYAARARRQFDGDVRNERPADHPGERAAAALESLCSPDGTRDVDPDRSARSRVVLVPPTIPHDAAVYLERAGYELRSTTAVAEARATKTSDEIDAVRAVQRAAERGVRRGGRVLAAAEVGPVSDEGDDSGLLWDGAPLTVERLRREVNAELARCGVSDARNTSVAVGAEGRRSDATVHRDEAIAIEVAPRGPHGYHGHLARTVVVDSDGGWERRAYVACEAALDAALGEVEPGADADDVRREATAELAAFGFDPGGGDGGPNAEAVETVHGVGLARRERPRSRSGATSGPRSDATLEPGVVLAVTPSVTDPERGSVRLSELVVVTDEGDELLGDGAHSFTPRE